MLRRRGRIELDYVALNQLHSRCPTLDPAERGPPVAEPLAPDDPPVGGPTSSVDVDVLVIGAGPTGLTLASLLADQGVRVHVVEADSASNDEPRAIALADESLRTAHALGILADFRSDVVWNSGTRYLGAHGQLLARVQPRAPRLGFPAKTLFDQPGYVAAALLGLGRRPLASISYSTTMADFTQDEDRVQISMSTPDGPATVVAAFLVGCDGGRSAVRRAMGVKMVGSSQTHPWIVVDTVEDPYDSGDTEFYCRPERPHVRVPGTHGRCRYEFMLLPHESAENLLRPESIAGLLAPYRTVGPDQIRRARVYTGHQLVAERWRAGRALLAGDAAHLMPPFAGQGLNTGLRDARNLAWKLAAVLRAEAGETLLDSYQAERRPHAVAMVDFSARLGSFIMTADARRARIRDAALTALRVVPPARRYLTELRFVPRPVYRRGCIAPDPEARSKLGRLRGGATQTPTLRGTPLPQGPVIDTESRVTLLDDVLGQGWALLSLTRDQATAFAGLDEVTDLPPGTVRVALLPPDRVPRAAAQRVVVAEQQPILHAGPPGREARFLLVRPDRYVAADFTASDAAEVLADLGRTIWPANLDRASSTTTETADGRTR